MSDRFHQVEELFTTASEMAPEERDAWLERACADPELQAEVKNLLARFDDAAAGPDLIAERLHEAVSDLTENNGGDPLIGEICGGWRIEKLLGQGGMGAVYLGVRESDEYRQKAAIKMLRFGPASGEYALERLRQERRILAGLEHPNITRFIDGGAYATPSGARLPFLAMEYVDGQPLLKYAAHHQLGLAARIRLFQKICQAVQFAHQNLIVHRDLKPGNVLVTADGEPKLLDFGIAKLVDPVTDAPQETATRVFTPDYASPEQLRGENALPASDIYSLGAILYEMLTGSRCSAAAEPARPNSRGGPFAGKLAGDLDNIVLMALRADPKRRYASAGQLAEDLERYLEQLPVMARPDTFVYRTSKLVRRHWVALAATAGAFVALAVGLGVAVYEGRIANARFQDVRSLANTFLFDFDKEISSVPGNTKARHLLVATARKYLDSLAATAGNDEGLLAELATSYEKLGDVQGMPGLSNLGLTREAADSYAKAVSILERLAKKNPKYRAQLATDLSRSGRIAGELFLSDEALEVSLKAAAISEQLHEEAPGDTALARSAANSYGVLTNMQRGIYLSEDAMESSRKAVALFEQTTPAHAPPAAYHPLALALSRLAFCQRDLWELDAAEESLRRGLDLENRILAVSPTDPRSLVFVASLYEDLAMLQDSDRYPSHNSPEQAIALLREAVRRHALLAEADPNDVRAQGFSATAKANLAFEYLRRNERALAGRLSEEAMTSLETTLRRAPKSGLIRSKEPVVAYARAAVLAELGRKAEAVKASQLAVDGVRTVARGAHFSADTRLDVAGQLLRHAQVLVRCGEREAAQGAMQEAAGLLAGVDAEIRRLICYAEQAGAYRFELAKTMEAAGLKKDAAANYGEAVKCWSPWQKARPEVQRRVKEAEAGRARN